MYCSGRAGRHAWQHLVRHASRPFVSPSSATTTTITTTTTTPTTPTIQTRGVQTVIRRIKSTRRQTTGRTARQFASRPDDPDGAPQEETTDTAQPSDAPSASTLPPSRPLRTKRIFSGIQPTGVPHLGNYLGALREWKRLQDTADDDTDLFFCIVDLHALTVPRQSNEMRANRNQMLAALLAMGLDPYRSVIYFQSAVALHVELQWILSCTASMGYLSRMTQWKSKMQLDENASLDDPAARKGLKLGLLSYPVLQAADILVHRATHVPVGEDQRQHLEFARECVTNFNHTYKTDIFVPPQTILSPSRRIMSLTNPLQKMSKSDPSPKSRVLITDSPEDIAKKIKQAVTDSNPEVTYEPDARPGVANLIEILAGFDPQGRTAAQLGEQMKDYKTAELKQLLAQVISDELAPVRERYEALLADPRAMHNSIHYSRGLALTSATRTRHLIRDATGIGLFA